MLGTSYGWQANLRVACNSCDPNLSALFPSIAIASGEVLASSVGVSDAPKRFVYILRSVNHPERPYVGLTSNVATRLAAHNAGQNVSTAAYKPWEVIVSVEFRTEDAAVRFERYLKSGSGRAFAKRHFV